MFYQNPEYNPQYLPKTFASLSAIPGPSGWNALDRFDITPYLCQLLKVANVPNVDPLVLAQNEQGFDYENFLNSYFSQLSSIGANERVNFGQVWNAVSLEFLPRAFTQIEIAQAGGCQVIDNYICTADGTKIKEASSTCKEGIEFLKPITSEELESFIVDFIQNVYKNHSEAFVQYIKTNFLNNGWNIKLIYYSTVYLFIVEASRETTQVINGENFTYTEKLFKKYYQDQKEYISSRLGISLTNITDLIFDEIPQNYAALSEALLENPIPDYTKLV